MKFLKIVYKILFSVAIVMLIHIICAKANVSHFHTGVIEGFFFIITYRVLEKIENGN